MKRKKLYCFLAFLNTLVLFLLTFWFWSLPWLAGDEKLMIWASSTIKLLNRDSPDSEDFALINVSYDNVLIDRVDEFGFPVGNQPITDRVKLQQLIAIINKAEKKPKYTFLDLYFEDTSENDSLLRASLVENTKLIVSTHLDDDNQLKPIVLPGVKTGLSDYTSGSIFDGVYKFQLYFNDSSRLTPLIIYEETNMVNSEKIGPFVKVGDQYVINHFVLNYRLLQKDIEDPNAGFNPINLGELLWLPEDDIAEFLENKIVVLGDFHEQDMHETMFEITAGPVILINAYLSLVNEDGSIGLMFFILLFAVYFVLSYLAIYPEDMLELHIKRRYGKYIFVRNITSFMSYLLGLTLLSLITYFLFDVHLNVFVLSLYLFTVEKSSTFLYSKNPQERT